MAEPTLTQLLSSVLGAAVPGDARQQLLAAAIGRTAGQREEPDAVVIPLAPRRQAPESVSDRPFAA